MHAVAEKGIAAHWMYKEHEGPGHTSPQQAAVWLQSLIDIQHETRDSAEFLEHLKIDLFPESVYVLTPKSRIVALPKGATPVDFAYAIHSGVGDRCVSAKVNGEPVPLRAQLHSGDVIEIITAPSAKPNPGWLNFVRTGRARSKIRSYLKNMEAEESLDLGEKLLAQALRAEGLTMPAGDEESEGDAGALWQSLIRWGGNRSQQELMADIGLGRKIATMVAKRLAHLMAESGERPDALTLSLGRFAADDAPSQGSVVIDGSEGATVQLAPCCCPVPGDPIVGYLGRGEGLVVHTQNCGAGRRLFERDSERWIDVVWSDEPTRAFESIVSVLVTNGKGVLAQVAASISSAETDITHIEMGDERMGETAELRLTLSVRDTEHLTDVLRTLRRCAVVLKAERVCA
jgi:guanosine-3',5'-bis(diphosphate) 3'-pyrophosphohydrolase